MYSSSFTYQNDALIQAYLLNPFGMIMPGRSNSYGNADAYRYAYNGMERDNEVSGPGNSYTTEFRQYDPRLGRWKSLDPLMHQFPWMSPYVAFDNNPVFYTDIYGLSSDGPDDPPEKKPGQANEDGSFDEGDYQELPEVVISPKNKATYETARKNVKTGKMSTSEFLRQYEKYDWADEHDHATVKGTGPNASYDNKEAAKIWGDPIQEIKVNLTVAVVIGVTAGGAAAFVTTGGATYVSDYTLFTFIRAQSATSALLTKTAETIAGRILIYSTSVVFGTTVPSLRNGRVRPASSFTPINRAPAGGVFNLSNGKFYKGGRFMPGSNTFTTGHLPPTPSNTTFGSPFGLEPWPANPLTDIGLKSTVLRTTLENPWVRGAVLGGGTYFEMMQLQQQFKKQNE